MWAIIRCVPERGWPISFFRCPRVTSRVWLEGTKGRCSLNPTITTWLNARTLRVSDDHLVSALVDNSQTFDFNSLLPIMAVSWPTSLSPYQLPLLQTRLLKSSWLSSTTFELMPLSPWRLLWTTSPMRIWLITLSCLRSGRCMSEIRMSCWKDVIPWEFSTLCRHCV